MQPLIVQTVKADSMAALVAARDGCHDADLVELRLDDVRDLDVARALRGRQQPVVVTCRPTWEGGHFAGSERTRQAVLQQALELGAEYVDVEWRAGFEDLVRVHREHIVLSCHDFRGVPVDLEAQASAMRALGTALIKIAVMPSTLSELMVLERIARAGAAVVIGMGEVGQATRILAGRFGSRWTYAGPAVAPGQIPVRRLVEEFRFRRIDAATEVYGVVGNNVMHSLSPAMHNAAFAAVGRNAVYVPFLTSEFADFLAFADALDVQGASVTIPFKMAALGAAVEVDAMARAVGAANTLKRSARGWLATNTDVAGLVAPLEAVYPGSLSGVRVAVLGAGGAARAAVVGLQSRGAVITVHARRSEAGRTLARAFGVAVGPWPVPPGSWEVLVNCTPAGSAVSPDESPLPGGRFGGVVVYDLTYRSDAAGESPLIRDARLAGCVVLDGRPMLVAQAEQQFTWWTGAAPPRGVMAGALGPLHAAV